MKKIYFIMMIAVVAMLGLASCSDDDYTSKYTDPSKTNTVTCDKLMTGVFLTGKQYAQSTYWRLFTFDTQFIGRLASTYGYTSDKDAYGGVAEDYNDDRWENFYNMLSQYKLLEYTYDNLSESDQEAQEIYKMVSKVYVYDQLQQMVDLWGDVPYSEACTVQLTSDITTAYPSYDSAESLYEMMLDDLGSIVNKLDDLNESGLDEDVASSFASQDYICKGDIPSWGRYANGLRARIAMRCATNGNSLASKGQAALKECFASGNLFTLDDVNDDIRIDVGEASGDWNLVDNWLKSGWESWTHSCNTASDFMLELMGARADSQDPRLRVMFAYNNADQVYRGKDAFEVPTYQSAMSDSANYYSCLDSATFSRNAGYFEPTMTAAEFLLIGAEAAERGYISGNAEEYFKKGMKASIDYYFALNAASTYYSDAYHMNKFAKPGDDEIDDYVNTTWAGSTNHIQTICEQYWIHLGIPYAVQAYANVRRTGYPELTYVDWSNQSTEYPLPFDRLKYPSSETMNNTTNCQAAIQEQFGGTDTWYQPIFWAKSKWYNTISEPKE